MNRLVSTLNTLKENCDKFLVAYLTGGVPDMKRTIEYVKAIEKGGADIIEIGVPFSDALADGPINQEAALRAIRNGIRVDDIFKMTEEIHQFSVIPVVFLIYYNTIFHYGQERFIKDCRKYGVDGLVIPDLPMEEREEIIEFINDYDICLIPLVAPNSRDRIASIVSGGAGFTYCVSSMGVTGERTKFRNDIADYINSVKEISNLPTAVGFGISDSKAASYFYRQADGIIVGSAIVKRIMDGCTPEELTFFIKTLKYSN